MIYREVVTDINYKWEGVKRCDCGLQQVEYCRYNCDQQFTATNGGDYFLAADEGIRRVGRLPRYNEAAGELQLTLTSRVLAPERLSDPDMLIDSERE